MVDKLEADLAAARKELDYWKSRYEKGVEEYGKAQAEIERLQTALDSIEGQAVCVGMDGGKGNEQMLVYIAAQAKAARAGDKQSQGLQDAATGALERLRARRGESADEWAEKLAPTFFADLDRPAAALAGGDDPMAEVAKAAQEFIQCEESGDSLGEISAKQRLREAVVRLGR